VSVGLYRLTRENSFTYQSLDELSGRVAVLRTKTISAENRALQKAGLKLIFVETVKQGVSLLLEGRVEYSIGDNTTLTTKFGRKLSNKIQFSNTPMLKVQVGIFYNLACERKLFKQTP